MTPTDFIRKWSPGGTAHELNERAGAQPHFIDLCRLLGVPEPADPEHYCFERGLVKTGSAAARTDGFADVWLRGHFAWEYKRPGRSLKEALKQLMLYALPLENPPLLVVSDRLRIEVHTHFTGTPSECHVFALADLADAELRQRLRTLWTQPDAWRPRRSNRDITEAAAQTFAGTAARLRAAGVAPEQVSHFLTQCLLCFFAEDVGLLPERLFERLVGVMITPERLRSQLTRLFETMRDGGLFGVDDLPWFNGGLFKTIAVPPLDAADVAALKAASAMNWSAIDPSIFGTLFERGLDPAVRAALGANYTDPATIQRLVEPVVQRPLLAEWSGPGGAKERIAAAMARSKRHGDKAWRDAQAAFVGFLERLRGFRVLDAACGSGNFLYLALKALKDIEHLANHEAEALGLERQHDVTGPHNVLGIELNEYAAELARVTVWIGELQWRIQRGYAFKTHPVLEPLDHIECRDALMTPQGEEAAWPAVDVLVGNPPFVGDKKMRGELGAEYTERLRRLYQGRVPGGADLVCYWFEKARAAIEAGRLQRAGLVSTNSIRGGRNREVLDRICTSTRIFEAWSDEPWVNDGAAVRVSLVGFGQSPQAALLDGKAVHRIGPELAEIREGGASLSSAVPLTENQSAAYQGPTKGGRFDVPGDTCRGWLVEPTLGTRPIWTVLKPWANGDAVTSRWPDSWIIDFNDMPADQAALLEQPFDWVVRLVKPERDGNAEKRTREMFWQFKRLGTDCQGSHQVAEHIHRHARGLEAPCLRPPTVVRRPGQELGRGRARRLHNLRRAAKPNPRGLGASTRHEFGRPAEVHVEVNVPNLPLPHRPDPRRHRAPANRGAGRRRADPGRAAGGAAAPGRGHRPRRPAAGHAARRLAQPAGVDRARARDRAAGADHQPLPGPGRRQTRLREGAGQTYADEPLQPAPRLARPGPRRAGPRGRHRLRLERRPGHAQRRRDPAPAAGGESGAGGGRGLKQAADHCASFVLTSPPSS
jgi:hypothetical protein